MVGPEGEILRFSDHCYIFVIFLFGIFVDITIRAPLLLITTQSEASTKNESLNNSSKKTYPFRIIPTEISSE